MATERKRETRERQSAGSNRGQRSATASSGSGQRRRTALASPESGQRRRAASSSNTDQRQRAASSSSRAQVQPTRRPPVAIIVAIIVLLGIVVFAGRICINAAPINVTVNGTQQTLRGAKNLQVAIDEAGFPVNPGDYITLKGSIIERSKGHPFAATVNGEATVDPAYQLHNGDVVTVRDGDDIVEEYTYVEEAVPYESEIRGSGPIHKFEPGTDGVKEIRTGVVSGEVVEKQTVEPTNLSEVRTTPNVGDDKVIALTFDDGPSQSYTHQILDVLAKNDAKATFFVVGSAVKDNPDLVKRAADEGHQICSHSYNNAVKAGGDLSNLTADEQVSEVEGGFTAIQGALGYLPNKIVRLPGSDGMYGETILNLADKVDAEIGWTVDTGDWVYMTEDEIYDVLMSAQSGDVIRMHDGGDHQDITAEALKRALPELTKKGYRFITIDELMQYPSS